MEKEKLEIIGNLEKSKNLEIKKSKNYERDRAKNKDKREEVITREGSFYHEKNLSSILHHIEYILSVSSILILIELPMYTLLLMLIL